MDLMGEVQGKDLMGDNSCRWI